MRFSTVIFAGLSTVASAQTTTSSAGLSALASVTTMPRFPTIPPTPEQVDAASRAWQSAYDSHMSEMGKQTTLIQEWEASVISEQHAAAETAASLSRAMETAEGAAKTSLMEGYSSATAAVGSASNKLGSGATAAQTSIRPIQPSDLPTNAAPSSMPMAAGAAALGAMGLAVAGLL